MELPHSKVGSGKRVVLVGQYCLQVHKHPILIQRMNPLSLSNAPFLQKGGWICG